MGFAISIDARTRVGAMGVHVSFEAGVETVAVVGPNGAGKTTFLSMLLGAVPAQGYISIGGQVLLDSSTSTCVPIERRGLAYVPQDYALFPHLDVRGNVAFAVASRSVSKAHVRHRVDEVLSQLGLEGLGARRPHELSGGERQRVALARALATKPVAILLDEPVAALDVHARKDVRNHLHDLLQRLALPAVVVTHDPVDAQALAQTIVVLERGQVTQKGPWIDLSSRPASAFVAAFVAPSVEKPPV